VKEHLVMTVRADARGDLTQIIRVAWPEAENHHATIKARGSRAVVHPWQVITGDVSGQ
jgi:hypothetical protein